MIIVTTSELTNRSLFAKHYKGNYIPSSILETHTGADLMITPDKCEVNCNSIDGIRQAVSDGAILVQLKFGSDLLSSIGDRLNRSHVKMCQIGATPNQRWLVFLGILHTSYDAVRQEDVLYINSNEAYGHHNIQAYYSAMIGWSMRGNKVDGYGGNAINLTDYDQINPFLKSLQRSANGMYKYKLVHMLDKPVFNVDTVFGQDVIAVKDIRLTWASIDGIGPEKAHQLWLAAGDRGVAPDMDFFRREVIDLGGKNLAGFGKGIAEKAKKWLYPKGLK